MKRYKYSNPEKTVVLVIDEDDSCRLSGLPSIVPEGIVIEEPDVVTPYVEEVTMQQAQRALLRAGLLDTIETMVQASNDRELKISWNKSTTINRNDYFTQQMITALSLTTEQVNQLFATAASL